MSFQEIQNIIPIVPEFKILIENQPHHSMKFFCPIDFLETSIIIFPEFRLDNSNQENSQLKLSNRTNKKIRDSPKIP